MYAAIILLKNSAPLDNLFTSQEFLLVRGNWLKTHQHGLECFLHVIIAVPLVRGAK